MLYSYKFVGSLKNLRKAKYCTAKSIKNHPISFSNIPNHIKEKLKSDIDIVVKGDKTSNEFIKSCKYMNVISSIPWDNYNDDKIDINNAKEIFDQYLYGLNNIKQRIIEILMNESTSKEPLILIGPQGLGKRTLAHCISKILNRKSIYLNSEAKEVDIFGDSNSPGVFLSELCKNGTNNPIIIVEYTKDNYEDGEENYAIQKLFNTRHQYFNEYVNIPIDLSKSFFIFIAQSNDILDDWILNQFNLINFPLYSHEDKFNIIKNFILPKYNITNENINVKLEDDIIKYYVNESSGSESIRSLEKGISRLILNLSKLNSEGNMKDSLTYEDIDYVLNKINSKLPRVLYTGLPGISNAVSVSKLGGFVITIEAAIHRYSDGPPLILTGNVYPEVENSAEIAYLFIRNFLTIIQPNNDFFFNHNIHIHIPSLDTVIQGSSAGLSIATSLLSLALNIPIKEGFAMTGSLSLNGSIGKVYQIHEKVLGCKRDNIFNLILPEKNKHEFNNLSDDIKSGIHPYFVKDYNDVFKVLFS